MDKGIMNGIVPKLLPSTTELQLCRLQHRKTKFYETTN